MPLLLAVFVVMAPIPFELGPAWADFSRAPARHLIRTRVEVGTLGYDQGRKRLDFWLRRPVVSGEHDEEIAWADTRTCAAARTLLASMRDIPVPKFAPISTSEGPPVIVDGISYRLRTYSDQGTLTAETNLGTPLAAWVNRALATLNSCWVRTAPQRNR
ncbi:hypothetical protein GCM10022276_12130 [Sphingomonas limnosediminicola]|uniref:Uncharacterized protein n=1 Tax=Sphingomonas limnosediminicola TaxID=940133 RepID=A0ABP7L433_9SPHN